ncbi:MAG: M48 family metalloprotease [Pseudomonadota bacterium]
MTTRARIRTGLSIAAAALALTGCVTNPVTGRSELTIISAQQEVAMGANAYAPMQQSQGGQFRLDPAVGEYVARVGQKMADVSDRDLPYEFVVLNNGVPNAWALPGGKIAINRGLLLEMNSEAELAAVLGHEVVHAAAKHSVRQMQRGMLLQALVVGTAVVTNDSDYGQLATGAANVGASLLTSAYSRGAESEADLYGMRYMSRAGYDPQGAVDLQRTFLALSANRPPSGPNLFASHPPSQQRLTANAATAQELPAGGTVGRDSYAAAMRTLTETAPAFERYDAGRKALSEKKYDTAMQHARAAISAVPAEASFHGLAGDIELMRDDTSDAITHYTRALDRDATFFYYHLQRGIARERRGSIDGAKVDLENSLRLFETAPAQYTLGKIALAQRNTGEARQRFAAAAQAPGDVGLAARGELMRLDLANNPGQYINVRTGTDDAGQLLVRVENPNPLAVRSLVFRIRYLDSANQVRDIQRTLNGTLSAGTGTTLSTGLGPFTSAQQFEVTLVSAALAE